MSIRSYPETRAAQQTMEGAGGEANTVLFGFQDPSELDPFLLFDDYPQRTSADYRKRVHVHPHAGSKTIHLCAGKAQSNTGIPWQRRPRL